MRRTLIFSTLLMCMICAALFPTGSVMGQDNTEFTDVVISENDHESELLALISEGDQVDVSVDVTSPAGGRIDVYVISHDQINDYPHGSFTPALVREGVSNTDFTFTVPDDQRYYLVLDNRDNSRPSDTVPVGSVTVDYVYSNPWLEEAEEAILAGMMFCLMALIIIVVIIVIVIILVVKSDRKSHPPTPPPYIPQQPYQQPYPQPYQQPYPPPPGQQPPYQPPPGQQPPPY